MGPDPQHWLEEKLALIQPWQSVLTQDTEGNKTAARPVFKQL